MALRARGAGVVGVFVVLVMVIGRVVLSAGAEVAPVQASLAAAPTIAVATTQPVQLQREQVEVRVERPQAEPAKPRYRVMTMEVTAYCPCKICCGKGAKGITASGHSVQYNGGAFVAADRSVLPMYSKVIVPGYAGETPIPVIDTGSAIVGHRLDVFFPTHAQAKQWGRQTLQVAVLR